MEWDTQKERGKRKKKKNGEARGKKGKKGDKEKEKKKGGGGRQHNRMAPSGTVRRGSSGQVDARGRGYYTSHAQGG